MDGQGASGAVFPGVYKLLDTKDPTRLSWLSCQEGRRMQHDSQGPIPMPFFFFKDSTLGYTFSCLLIHQAV